MMLQHLVSGQQLLQHLTTESEPKKKHFKTQINNLILFTKIFFNLQIDNSKFYEKDLANYTNRKLKYPHKIKEICLK